MPNKAHGSGVFAATEDPIAAGTPSHDLKNLALVEELLGALALLKPSFLVL
jgi:hypothetical protein